MQLIQICILHTRKDMAGILKTLCKYFNKQNYYSFNFIVRNLGSSRVTFCYYFLVVKVSFHNLLYFADVFSWFQSELKLDLIRIFRYNIILIKSNYTVIRSIWQYNQTDVYSYGLLIFNFLRLKIMLDVFLRICALCTSSKDVTVVIHL